MVEKDEGLRKVPAEADPSREDKFTREGWVGCPLARAPTQSPAETFHRPSDRASAFRNSSPPEQHAGPQQPCHLRAPRRPARRAPWPGHDRCRCG